MTWALYPVRIVTRFGTVNKQIFCPVLRVSCEEEKRQIISATAFLFKNFPAYPCGLIYG